MVRAIVPNANRRNVVKKYIFAPFLSPNEWMAPLPTTSLLIVRRFESNKKDLFLIYRIKFSCINIPKCYVGHPR